MIEEKQVKVPAGYEEIAELAKAYAQDHEALREQVKRIRDEQRKAGSRLLPGLKKKAATASAARDALVAAIKARPELWGKPRTRELHGVKVGLRQLPGRLEIDAAEAIPLIRKHMPERFKALVQTTSRLRAGAIKALPPAMLRRIGGDIVELGDEVVTAIPKSAVDKLVEALLADLDSGDGE